MSNKQVIGGPLVIDGRTLSLSRAIRACLDSLKSILDEAGCELSDVVKSMVWLKNHDDFSGFNQVYSEYFLKEPLVRLKP